MPRLPSSGGAGGVRPNSSSSSDKKLTLQNNPGKYKQKKVEESDFKDVYMNPSFDSDDSGDETPDTQAAERKVSKSKTSKHSLGHALSMMHKSMDDTLPAPTVEIELEDDVFMPEQVVMSKSDIGFVDGEKKAPKPDLSEDFKANMTTGTFNRFNKAMYYKGPVRFLESKRHDSAPVETILIHGTFNPDAPERGWTRPDIKANEELRERYGGKLSSIQWSGKNHREARVEAGKALAERIERNYEKGIETNIIAHSHGGNVAFEALKLLESAEVKQLITLGTPIRDDHIPSREFIASKVNTYIHVSGGKDSVAGKGGVDWVKPGRGTLKIEKRRRGFRAKKDTSRANLHLHISDATHSELHRPQVLGQFGPKGFSSSISEDDEE
ncbi:MAG: esterase/lipase family protein [Endozoicomonas sp.]|uniref:esterase/lipase family protein n=1 Tax=Endozoicomonas sp. TaxID=1892382 RepID=UPI003D9ACB7F